MSKSKYSLTLLLLTCLLAASLPATPLYAQRGGDDDRRERDRDDDRRRDDDDDRRRWGREPDDQNEVQRDADRRREFMSRLDQNRDGKITREEVGDRWWGRIEQQAREAGLDASGAISLENYLNARKSQESTRVRERMRADNPTAFLAPLERTPPPGFDTPLSDPELTLLKPDRTQVVDMSTTASGSSEARSNRSSEGSEGESREDRTARYANSLIERYDKNGNNILEREEWKDMRGNPEESDKNGDGRITREELVARFSSYRRGGDDSGGRDSGDSRSDDDRRGRSFRERGSSSEREEEQAHATYRFTSALDRLPRDARSWIERYDKNGDAQVSMAEFTSSWSDSKVREYQKYDLNADGVVTGLEYVASKER